MRPHQVTDGSSTWWVQGRVVRKWVVPLVSLYTATVVGLAVWDALDGGTTLVGTAIGSLLVSAAVVLWARSHTRVSGEGIEIVEVRRRAYSWSQIAAVRGSPPGGYSVKVQIELTSSRTITLPGVDPQDLNDVVGFRPDPPTGGGFGE